MTSDHKGLNQIPEAAFERRLMKAGLFNICSVHAAKNFFVFPETLDF